MSADYGFAKATVDYAKKMVKMKANFFDYTALDELLKWVVLPAGDEKREPFMLGEMIQRAQSAAASDSFRRGPHSNRCPQYRQIADDTLVEFARLIREQAFNEFKAQHEQAVRT